MGMLPLRTHRQLYLAIAWDRLKRRLGFRPRPRYDVAFLGRPNITQVVGDDGKPRLLDQRVSWLRELRRDGADLKFGGGFTDLKDADFRPRVAREPDLRAMGYKYNSVTFPAYWRTVTRSRVLLAPGGNAPWTFRHYEALYAGATVVTIDFRRRDLLVPLPREGIVHVPDGSSVLPAVREALALSQSRPSLAEENFEFLERYLHYGRFARSRQALIDRFSAQLD
jgi:hypothetical protein